MALQVPRHGCPADGTYEGVRRRKLRLKKMYIEERLKVENVAVALTKKR
jgi:hypothetical protein